MGDAYLCQTGGNIFRGLVVLSAPAKTEYFSGAYFDPTGMVIGADFGTIIVPVSQTEYTYAPLGTLNASDTTITVTATVGGRTKSVSVPITVVPISRTFGDNSWEAIAYIAANGQAGDYWRVGDSKVYNGITYTIIGMDHDDLSTTDARYSDTSYNQNSKKAALTLQIMTNGVTDHMNPRSSGNIGGWDQCYMRNTVLQNYYAGMPADLRSVIRTVDKTTSIGGYNTTETSTSKDQLFLLAGSEMYPSTTIAQYVLQGERIANPRYAYYANGGITYKGAREWTRSPHRPDNCPDSNHFIGVNNSGNPNAFVVYTDIGYFPAFCI